MPEYQRTLWILNDMVCVGVAHRPTPLLVVAVVALLVWPSLEARGGS